MLEINRVDPGESRVECVQESAYNAVAMILLGQQNPSSPKGGTSKDACCLVTTPRGEELEMVLGQSRCDWRKESGASLQAVRLVFREERLRCVMEWRAWGWLWGDASDAFGLPVRGAVRGEGRLRRFCEEQPMPDDSLPPLGQTACPPHTSRQQAAVRSQPQPAPALLSTPPSARSPPARSAQVRFCLLGKTLGIATVWQPWGRPIMSSRVFRGGARLRTHHWADSHPALSVNNHVGSSSSVTLSDTAAAAHPLARQPHSMPLQRGARQSHAMAPTGTLRTNGEAEARTSPRRARAAVGGDHRNPSAFGLVPPTVGWARLLILSRSAENSPAYKAPPEVTVRQAPSTGCRD
ncbi:hypothetical protein FH972_021095 [Carpinus fangiana]|uniref:Uncharacterized protein n=1 Tax=Carpinus fangiana TaxID=176857 RepID=A0A5N6KNQ5_9ROSI|nr:hypothetical protein FH972_021095 [Carpinus fangiana]